VGRKTPSQSGTETRRFGALVRMAEDVRDAAKELADLEGGSGAEIIDAIVRPVLMERLKAARRRAARRKPKGEGDA
jgi:hypothetical protein